MGNDWLMLMLSYIYNVFHSIFFHAMDELFMSEIKKKQFHTDWFSFKQLQMSSILSQIRKFSNFYLRSFSIGIKTISKIDFSKLITNARKATLLYVQYGFTMIGDISALLSGTNTHTHTYTITYTHTRITRTHKIKQTTKISAKAT